MYFEWKEHISGQITLVDVENLFTGG